MTTLAAGELDKLINIEALTQTKDSSGGMVDSWVPFAQDVWAKVMNLSGNEKKVTAYGGQVAEARTVFTVRHMPGITETKHRITFEGKLYNIKHLNDYNAKKVFMLITCDTGVNDGR